MDGAGEVDGRVSVRGLAKRRADRALRPVPRDRDETVALAGLLQPGRVGPEQTRVHADNGEAGEAGRRVAVHLGQQKPLRQLRRLRRGIAACHEQLPGYVLQVTRVVHRLLPPQAQRPGLLHGVGHSLLARGLHAAFADAIERHGDERKRQNKSRRRDHGAPVPGPNVNDP